MGRILHPSYWTVLTQSGKDQRKQVNHFSDNLEKAMPLCFWPTKPRRRPSRPNLSWAQERICQSASPAQADPEAGNSGWASLRATKHNRPLERVTSQMLEINHSTHRHFLWARHALLVAFFCSRANSMQRSMALQCSISLSFPLGCYWARH